MIFINAGGNESRELYAINRAGKIARRRGGD
jgi:hypothetical protein